MNCCEIENDKPVIDEINRKYSLVGADLVWNANLRNAKEGAVAGWVALNGYRYVNVLGKCMLAHRVIWRLSYGYWPKLIDHIDGNKQNNAISNLREADWYVNTQNLRKARSNNRTGMLGVSFNKKIKRWIAAITANGKRHYIGCFTDKEKASEAYLVAKRNLQQGCTI